jgi:hypothetical protein
MTITQNTSSPNTLIQREFGGIASLGALVAIPRQSGVSSAVPATYYDSGGNDVTAESFWDDYDIEAAFGVQVSNINPELADLDGTRLTRITDGTGAVEFVKGSVKGYVGYSSTAQGGGSTFVFDDYVPGTVSAHLGDQIKALLNSDPDKRELEYFSIINHTTATYERNPNCWARDLDISGLAVGSEIQGPGSDNWTTQRAGVLVTPRHVLLSWHYKPELVGEKFRFVTPEGVIREAAIAGYSSSGNSVGFHAPDQAIIALSDDIEGCTPMKVGNDWVTQRVGVNNYYSGGLVIGLDKHRRMGLFLLGLPTQLQMDNPHHDS